MLANYAKMFSIISNIAKLQINNLPLPSHEYNEKKWYLTFDEIVNKLSNDVSKEEKESVQKVKQLFYSTTELFQKYASSRVSFDERKKNLELIFKKDQVEQRSEKWYEDMQHMITASEFSKLFESPRTRGQMVLSKVGTQEIRSNILAKPTEFLTSMDWGIRFEPVIREYLEEVWKCKIYECGRLKHQDNIPLGASPDGIIIESEDEDKYGRLVEIKCPYSREVGKKIPFEYWCQMQIQMEVTNLNECEYVEVEIRSKNPKNPTIIFEDESKIKNMYLLIKDNTYVYSYSEEGKENLLKQSYELVETVQYVIYKVHNVLVKRDKKWYESTCSLQKEFWDDVEKAKEGNYILPSSKRKNNDECLINDEK